ncbi:F-box/kelch-repeat protein At3g23880-like [Coffea eugenioides]|uniref:F-box/kelch-repeat protein At3g23880-like n=1 Tax=Coffea eugenioides TaxID=49369 RepID=UPI000F6079AF|nr:F-box/kelch-repeat protein At3g23880-like [Coffea eugenioides]
MEKALSHNETKSMSFLRALSHNQTKSMPFLQNHSPRSSSNAASIRGSNPFRISEHIPPDIIIEILTRLPAKSLRRFECVSQSWLSLISSPDFTEGQLRYRASVDNKSLLVFSKDSEGYSAKYFSINSLLNEKEATDVVQLDHWPAGFTHEYVTNLGSCNGLLCIASISQTSFPWILHARNCNFFLWNPSVGKIKILPNLGTQLNDDCCYVGYGFGYDEVNDDYKVMGIICSRTAQRTLYVYTTKTGIWRRTAENFHGDIPWDCSPGAFVNGRLHWALKKRTNGSDVVSFDLATEKFGMLDGPYHDNSYAYVKIFEASLGMFVDKVEGNSGVCEVWVMKDYGVTDSWTKVFALPWNKNTSMLSCSTVFCRLDDGKFCLLLDGVLGLYNTEDKSFKNLNDFLGSAWIVSATPFIESLVMPSATGIVEMEDNQKNKGKVFFSAVKDTLVKKLSNLLDKFK